MADNIIPEQITGGTGPAPTTGNIRAPDYRQYQQPVEATPFYRLPNSGAAGRAEELASTFRQFEGEASKLSNTLETNAGKTAGAAAGMDPNFKPATGLQAITAYGQAYDAAAHQTYITQSQLSLEKQLSGIEQSTIGNPDAFGTQATAAVQGALKNMDPGYVPEMTNWAQARIQAGVNRQSNQKAEDVRNTALATYQSSTPDLVTAALHTSAALPREQGDAVIAKLISDDQDRLNALVASRTITPEAAVTLHQKMVDNANQQMTGQRVDISLQPILAAMRGNVEAADHLILQRDPNLTDQENQIRQQEFEKDRQEYVQTQTRTHVDALAGLHQGLVAGNYGPDIEGSARSLYRAGAMTEEGYFSAMSESLRNQRGALEDDAKLQLVDQAVHGQSPPLDPKDPAAVAAADKYFQTHVAMAGSGVSDQQYSIGASEFVRQTGIVPKSVQSQIRAGMLSGDPTLVTRAAALAAKIRDVNPTADVFAGNARVTALAQLVNDNLRVGLPPQKAYAMALATTDIPPEQKKIRDTQYRTDVKGDPSNTATLQTLLQSKDGSTFGPNAPRAPVPMQAAYDGLVRQFYSQTGDIGKARELAGQQLRQTWSVTKINGPGEYQQFGIPDNQVATVRQDIASSVQAAGYTGDPSAVHLTPNSQTAASSGRIWSLTHVDASGSTDVLLGKDNRPLVYHVPTGPDFAKAQQALAAQKIADARHTRDIDRQNSADADRVEQQLSNYYLGAGTGEMGR